MHFLWIKLTSPIIVSIQSTDNRRIQSEYISARPQQAAPPDPGGPPAFKKIRLTENHSQSPPPLLKVDVRDPPSTGAYHPQVEAISPTPPNDPSEELRATKDDLLQKITKVDMEINKAEKTIAILKTKQASLEETTAKPAKVEEKQEVQPAHRSLAQKIYAENRKKANAAHQALGQLGPPIELPLYNQPSDVEICKEIIQRHQSFKSRLLLHLKKIKSERAARNTALADKYSLLSQEWLRRVEKVESSAKRKAKDAKNREFFEKVFTELRKQREDKERFNRVGSRIKSEADVEEIIDGLQEQVISLNSMPKRRCVCIHLFTCTRWLDKPQWLQPKWALNLIPLQFFSYAFVLFHHFWRTAG